MAHILDHILYGKLIVEGQPLGELQTLATSGNLTPQDGLLWHSLATLEPAPHTSQDQSGSLGIFHGSESSLTLAQSYHHAGDVNLPVYHYVRLPRQLLHELAGNLHPLLSLLDSSIPYPSAPGTRIEPLTLAEVFPWKPEERLHAFNTLLEYCGGDLQMALSLLGAAIDERPVLLYGFPGNTQERVALVQGLMALLPPSARPQLTFATHTRESTLSSARLAFSDQDSGGERWLIRWETEHFPIDETLDSAYIAHLSKCWKGNAASFLASIEAMESAAARIMPGTTLADGLRQVVERHTLDTRVLEGDVSAGTLIASLASAEPSEGDTQREGLERLLHHALETRDVEAARLVAQRMDADPELDRSLSTSLTEALETQPDSVYVFVRARLSEGADGRWCDRLKNAAIASLRVAIADGDTETLTKWLKLIAREPHSYDLEDVLHQGILAAHERAHQDSELARQLLLIAARHEPDVLDTLLADAALLAALPNSFGAILRDYQGDAVALLQNRGYEIFLVALARGAHARATGLFTPETLVQLWTLFTGDVTINLPETYQPLTIVEGLVANGAEWLSSEAMETLLTLLIANGYDDLFEQLLQHMNGYQNDAFWPTLASALQSSQRSMNDVLDLVGHIVAEGQIESQEAVNLYVGLLIAWQWSKEALPLMEQLVRLIQQQPTLALPTDVIWQLLDAAAANKAELIARVVAKRLVASFETLADEALLTEQLLQLNNMVQWSVHARQFLMNWWRTFIREQSLARLNRLDKAIDGKRALDEAREIVQTVLAFRKMMGKRSLQDFAEEVNTAFGILQALAESFDPSPKHPSSFDQHTIRAELAALEAALSPQERQILANNLKELAQLIAALAESRTKGSVVRRGEELDRQLMSGEQQPHSAVDAMKWLSGYLGGVQDKASVEGE